MWHHKQKNIPNKLVDTESIPTFQKNMRSIPHYEYYEVHLFWRK